MDYGVRHLAGSDAEAGPRFAIRCVMIRTPSPNGDVRCRLDSTDGAVGHAGHEGPSRHPSGDPTCHGIVSKQKKRRESPATELASWSRSSPDQDQLDSLPITRRSLIAPGGWNLCLPIPTACVSSRPHILMAPGVSRFVKDNLGLPVSSSSVPCLLAQILAKHEGFVPCNVPLRSSTLQRACRFLGAVPNI